MSFGIKSVSNGAFDPAASLRSFSTNFSGAPQSPISESGAWHHTSNAWANIITVGSPNRAVGTQTGSDGFNDSYAYLNGVWRPNVQATATIYKDPTIDNNIGSYEVELLLRVADSGTSVRGYECNLSTTGNYAQIVRWNGALGSFDFLVNAGPFDAPVTGDVMMATIVDGTITSYIKRASGGGFSVLCQTTPNQDTTWTDGSPGIAMWLGDAPHIAGEQKYGFSDYSVTEI